MAATFKVEGLRELDDALKELPKATGKNVLRRMLIKAATPIADAASAAAPVGTGRLQMSVTTGTKLSRRQKQLHRPESMVEVFVGAGALVQAITQEFGTRFHPPHPFLRPTWDTHHRQALLSMRDDLADEIESARARIARKAARIAAQIRR